jgi:hypothetical protein
MAGMSTTQGQGWLSITEYAKEYGVERSTVYKYMDAELVDYYRVRAPGLLVVRIRNTPPCPRAAVSTSVDVGAR